MNEIKINVEKKDGTIGFNFEEIKGRLSQKMETYKTMVFTEDSQKEAKSTVAELRKLKKAVNDKRVEVKKSFMQPYVEFEEKVKELDGLIEEPISFIGGQVEAFENKRMEERRTEIDTIYEKAVSDIKDYLPLERVFNPKWMNATTTKKSIYEELEIRAISVKNDLETINSMNSDAVEKALQVYKTSLSLTDAIQFINKWEAQKAYILKQQEEDKKREELRQKEREEREEQKRGELAEQVQSEPTVQDLGKPEDLKEEELPQVESVPVKESENKQASAGKVIYEIEADVFQIAQLEAAMREYGIAYRRL